MNKATLIDKIAHDADITKSAAAAAVQHVGLVGPGERDGVAGLVGGAVIGAGLMASKKIAEGGSEEESS